MFWVAVADHVVLNAEAKAGVGLLTSDSAWLHPSSTVAAPFRWWWAVGGHGHGRTGFLLVLLLICLLCDAARAPRRGWWAVVPPAAPMWAYRAVGWWRTRLGGAEATGLARPMRDAVVAALCAAVALAYVVSRDLMVGVSAHARGRGESLWDAMLRGRAVLVMQRETRELAAGLDAAASRRWTYRSAGLGAIAVLLVLAFVVAPHVAVGLGWDSTFTSRWLAGLFDGLAKWWNSLSPGQQLLLMVVLAAALAIPFGFGAGFFLAGGLTYLAAHGHGAASLLRDPKAATRSYLANRSLGGMAFDAGELALTFVPAGLGSAGGVAAKAAARGALAREAERYLADPAAWRAARLASQRGAARVDAVTGLWIVNGLKPRAHVLAGKVWKGEAVGKLKAWPASVRKAYPNGIRYTAQGFPDFRPYAVDSVQLTKFTGREADKAAATRAAGMPSVPRGWTWHHVEDGHTMLLVPSDLHRAVPHTGGHAVAKP